MPSIREVLSDCAGLPPKQVRLAIERDPEAFAEYHRHAAGIVRVARAKARALDDESRRRMEAVGASRPREMIPAPATPDGWPSGQVRNPEYGEQLVRWEAESRAVGEREREAIAERARTLQVFVSFVTTGGVRFANEILAVWPPWGDPIEVGLPDDPGA